MAVEITYETILILTIFIVVVFLIYRIFRFALRGSLVAIASFSFPWVANFLNLGLPIQANMQTGIQFAMLGVSLFMIYKSAHLIIKILKFISWPIRAYLRRRK